VLQTVNKIRMSSEASSLHCVWVRNERESGAPLVCVWMDTSNGGILRVAGCGMVPEIPAHAKGDNLDENSECASSVIGPK
jgi:hypothetical protein